jgi:pimeloyl-ACP methyl ester carboxylesterase
MEHTLELADGRTLSYAEWGSPDATPVFYFHGFPTSRHEFELARPKLEQSNLPIRVIAIDRPGFGTSTAKPNRTLLDWPSDVAEAADLLDIDRFAVLGVSAGGPYALACGYALPDRVTRVGVVVGIAPMAATGMDKAAIAQMPKNRWFRRVQFTMAAFAFSRGQEDKIVVQAMATMGEADQRALEQTATRNSFIEMTRGAFTQGGSAATHEAGLYLQPWGFDPAHITVPTDLWYGGADELVPATAGQWLAERIPRSSYTIWPQHGHITWCDSDEAIDVFTAVTANAPPGEQP